MAVTHWARGRTIHGKERANIPQTRCNSKPGPGTCSQPRVTCLVAASSFVHVYSKVCELCLGAHAPCNPGFARELTFTAVAQFWEKRMFKRAVLLFSLAILLAGVAPADEGMWLFNAFPKARVKAKYGFEPTQAWLDHVRLSSVRFNNGGSGSFVSANGLTFTNHHVGAGCVQQLSTEGRDYIKTGFYAKTQAEETKCPNLELNQLVGIEDVTDKVNAGVKPDMSAAEAGQAQRSGMSQVEKDCANETGLRCDVVVFYSGQVYN